MVVTVFPRGLTEFSQPSVSSGNMQTYKKRKTEFDSHHNNEEILCFALNCSNDGFVLLDEDDSVLFINKKFEEWTNIWNSTWNERPFPVDSLFLEVCATSVYFLIL